MEDVLSLYTEPYDPKRPVICLDEKPYQIISDLVEPIKAEGSRVGRYDYSYNRGDVCSIFVAIEPLTGKRIVEVSSKRKKADYARFLSKIFEQYKDADLIRLVQDNLNTHTYGALYEAFPAEKAYEMTRKIQFHYTPKHASWLNMVEVEISAFSRMCLDRRFDNVAAMVYELQSLVSQRSEEGVKINWTFNLSKARLLFKQYYIT